MGVSIQGLTADLSNSFGLENTQGALVADVAKDSPAQKAGLKAGDVITAFDGSPILKVRDLPRIVSTTQAGKTVNVDIWRQQKAQRLTLNVGQLPSDEPVDSENGIEKDHKDPQLGLSLGDLDGQTRQQLGLTEDIQGVLIANVTAGSPAASIGVRPGDVILRVNNVPVHKPEHVREQVRKTAESDHKQVVLLLSRDGHNRFVAVPLQQG